MSDHIHDLAPARLILANARMLYEKYDVGRPNPFNVFTVLRSPSDEVNLHSRFLHALLDHREPGRDKERRNLKDFLETVLPKKIFYNIHKTEIQREKDNIDLLIINKADPPWVVVIENKIWAGDRPRQLEGYHESVSPGIDEANIHILYLTPYGHEASEDSARSIKYKPISYKYDILPWLEACQRRAVNNPPLRESLAQYMEVVRGLTGLNIGAEYMEKLKDLCLEKDNFVLVSHLSEAHKKACIHLVMKMWGHIKEAMENEFNGVLETGPDPRISCVSGNGDVVEEKIENAITRGNNIRWHGLYYPLSLDKDNPTAPSLGVELESRALWYGIRCKEEDFKTKFDAIRKSLKEEGCEQVSHWGWWPWADNAFKKLKIDYLKIGEDPEQWLWLKNEDNVKKCAEEIAKELKYIWGKLPDDLKYDRE